MTKWKVHTKHFYWLSQGNALWAIIWGVTCWTSQFFHGTPFYLKELTENYSYSDFDVWQIFSCKWTKWAWHFKEKNYQCLLPMIKYKSWNKNSIFGNFVSAAVTFMASQYLKVFPMRLVVTLTIFIYLILFSEMCQYLEHLHISVNQCFPNDQCMTLQGHTWIKDPCRCKTDHWILTEDEKFTDNGFKFYSAANF